MERITPELRGFLAELKGHSLEEGYFMTKQESLTVESAMKMSLMTQELENLGLTINSDNRIDVPIPGTNKLVQFPESVYVTSRGTFYESERRKDALEWLWQALLTAFLCAVFALGIPAVLDQLDHEDPVEVPGPPIEETL